VNRFPGNKKADVLNVLVGFEMELGREALTALRADNGAGIMSG